MPALKVLQVLTAGVEPWLRSGTGRRGAVRRARHPWRQHRRTGRGRHPQPPASAAAVRRRAGHAGCGTASSRPGLRGRRVLLLGAGDIGRRVAAAVSVFDAEVTIVGRHARDGVRTLDRPPAPCCPSAQIVVVAVPNTPETTGLVDAGFLAALPDGALRRQRFAGRARRDRRPAGRIAHAGGCTPSSTSSTPEPLPADDPLWSAPNLVLTPHIGGGTVGWDDAANGSSTSRSALPHRASRCQRRHRRATDTDDQLTDQRGRRRRGGNDLGARESSGRRPPLACEIAARSRIRDAGQPHRPAVREHGVDAAPVDRQARGCRPTAASAGRTAARTLMPSVPTMVAVRAMKNAARTGMR